MLTAYNRPLLVCVTAFVLFFPMVFAAGSEHIPLNRLNHSIVIDGDLSKWGNLTDGGLAITERLDLVDGPPNVGNGAAAFKIAHDDQALYVAARVLDASVHTSEPLWEGDCLELYLDVRPVAAGDHRFGSSAYSPGVYHFVFAPPSPENPKAHWMRVGVGGEAVGDVEFAGKTLSDGYDLEIRIPLKSMGTSADRLKDPIGVDAVINDINIVNGQKTARAQYAIGGSASGYQDASVFPKTELIGAVAQGKSVMHLVPARLLPDEYGWNHLPRRTLGGGILVAAKSDRPGNVPLSISLRYLGNPVARTPADAQAIIPKQAIEQFAIPRLGLVGYRVTASLDATKTGQYEVTTYMANEPRSTTHFQSGYWSASAHSGLTAEASPGTDLANATANNQYQLFNGWKLSPAGKAIALPGDMPVKMLWDSGGNRLLIQTAGYHNQGLYLFDPVKQKIDATIELNQTWPGIALSQDAKTLFISGGGTGKILPFTLQNLSPQPPIALPEADGKSAWISGIIEVGSNPARLYALDQQHDRVCVLSTAGTSKFQQLKILQTGYAPLAVALSPDGESIAVSNWGGESISVFDVATSAESRVAVDSHPNELAWLGDGRLFVACSGANSIKVLRNAKVIETIKTSLDPLAPVGSTPIALAISPDQQRLYVANADNNDLLAVDISSAGHSRILGAVPTGWYPSALAVSPDGKTIYVGVGKGMSLSPNPNGQYIGDILNGAVECIEAPTEADLLTYTRQVIANTPVPQRQMQLTQSQQKILNDVFPRIHHVVWIIRENRTYDQVLGDLPFGNGDASLAMFGEDVTPNAHALARQFTLLDNLYCSGEVSQDGHEWCNAAYATDFTEKAWTNSYSERGQPDDDDRLTASPAGYLWDNCRRNHVSYRSYGERADFISNREGAPVFQGDKGLEGHASVAWSKLSGKRDYERADAFISELHDAEATGDWPAYMVMSLGEDHTQGGQANSFTPNACVASNDDALGKIVDAVSHSRFWANTAIFIMEDDAQDGPDHIDAHRTVGFVISPYTRRRAVDSTLYTTVSFVHSMELMLKLDPMTQYDSSAMPVFNTMTTRRDFSPYDRVPPRLDLAERNKPSGPDAQASAKLDLSGYDRCDPAALNAILWHLYKPDTVMPAPVRSVHWLQ
jgi:DNA-binding beta-propeller fold protein YncE